MKKLFKFIIVTFFLPMVLTVPGASQNVINANWSTQANEHKDNIGKKYTFYFPPGGTVSGRVWGTDIYTYDCSIASAAVHAGLITAASGGTVTIEIKAGQSKYKASVRNGVSSKDWGPFGGSFVFVKKNVIETPPSIPVLQATWNTQASDYRSSIGKRYSFSIPAGGTVSSRIWGTDVYTHDCSIASAAVHAGLISPNKGGLVTIEIRSGQSAYKGSVRNGVTSYNWGPFDGSFVFIINPKQQIDMATPSIQGHWAMQANDYSKNIGKRYSIYFPPGGTISGRVWGTDVYTYDCSIASAAVHAGLITPRQGGTVTIEIRAGQSSYKGTTRNGVSSKDWGPFGGSFVFIK